MRTLYHFATSPFARRTRLALAHKKLDVVLKDSRAVPAYHEEVKKLWPLRIVPVLVEDGFVVGDSTAITHYLDGAYPETARVWPTERDALRASLEIGALVDGVLDAVINLGTRYYALHGDAAWPKVQGELLGRAQGALDALADRATARTGGTLTDAGWCAADMWLFTATTWLEGLPTRAVTNPVVAQITSLPWSLPRAMTTWADTHRGRDDVKSLDA